MSDYKTINKIRYDRNLLELAEAYTSNKKEGQISVNDAKNLYKTAEDRGEISTIKLRTLEYILEHYKFNEAARKWLSGKVSLSKAINIPPTTEMFVAGTAVDTNPNAKIRSLLSIADDGSIPGRKIVINNTTLSSIDASKVIPAIIIKAFDNKPIEITDAQANPVTQGNDVIITGTSSFRFKTTGASVQATLTMIDGNVQALFEYTVIGVTPPPNPWKFSDSFTELPKVIDASQSDTTTNNPLDQLVLKNAQFLVSTYKQTVDQQELIVGTNFRADMSPTGILSVFETLIGGSGDLKLQGTINVPGSTVITPALKPWEFPWDPKGTAPGINLKASLDADPFSLGGTTFNAQFFRIYSAASEKWFTQNSTYAITVAYTGEFDIPSANSKIGVTAVTPPGAKTAKLIANFSNSPIGNFSELRDILGVDNILSFFPDAIQKGDLGGLGIQGASVTIGYDKKLDVRAASVTVGMPKLNWDIWPGTFEVSSASAKFDIQNPFESKTRQIDILVRGRLKIEGVTVDIAAQKNTDFNIIASVPDGFDIPLSQLMDTYAPGIPPVSDLSINALELQVAPGKNYSIMLLMAQKPKPWVIPLGVTELKFSNVGMFLLKPKTGNLSGSFSGTAEIAGVSLSARYDIPGDVLVRGNFPSVSLSEIVSFLIQKQIQVPSGFDLTFTQSYIILQKKGSDYKMEMGTVIDSIGSLAFVLEKGTYGWGFATGLQIEIDQLQHLSGGIHDTVNKFATWFPFQTFTLAISTLQDKSFTFPGFQQFNQQSLGKSKITLPAIAQGIQPGFFLYTSTVFTKKNKILGALIDLLKIPEGTQLDGFIAYLTQKKQFQLGVSLTTFLTPVKDVSQRTCSGKLGYENTCLTGTIMVIAGGSDGFAFSLAASLKTILQDYDLEFDIILTVVSNGVFVSGTLKVEEPLTFGPLQLGGLAIELGISFEGLPSFGFSGELMVEDLFDSTLAVLINTSNPSESMVAGALSNITLGDVVDKLVGEVQEELPAPIKSVLDEVAIKGTKDGAFEVPKGEAASTLEDALNNFEGEVIQSDFVNYGKQSSFPSTSEGMMIFNDADHGKWYITEQAGSGDSSTITHWQLIKNASGAIDVSKEAQLYFVPSPSGVSIGTFYYPQGMKISGRIQFLLFKVDVDIDIEINKGFKVDAQMDKISLISDNLFSITAEEGSGGPQVSISTFTQASAPAKFQKPHFFINGKMTILGASNGIFVDINESGASFEVTGSSLGGIFTGTLSGNFNAEKVNVGGKITVGIGTIDLGKLGSWHIDTGVYAQSNIYADITNTTAGAIFTAGFELGGDTHSLGEIHLDVNVGKLSDLPSKFFDAVKDLLVKLFTDPKYWAEMAAKVLGWVEDKIKDALVSAFGLKPEEAQAIVSALSAFCPIVTAVNVLG